MPHAVDTVRLRSGVTMAVMLRLSPTQAPWLAALLTIGWMVAVAITKDPMGVFGTLR